MKRPTIIVVLEKILCKLITVANGCFSFHSFLFFCYKRVAKIRTLTFTTEEEIVDQREDQSDAFYGILQVTQDSVPVQGESDDYSRQSVDKTDLEQSATGDLDPHAVRDQGWWWRHSSRDEAYYAQDEGRAEGSEEKSWIGEEDKSELG